MLTDATDQSRNMADRLHFLERHIARRFRAGQPVADLLHEQEETRAAYLAELTGGKLAAPAWPTPVEHAPPGSRAHPQPRRIFRLASAPQTTISSLICGLCLVLSFGLGVPIAAQEEQRARRVGQQRERVRREAAQWKPRIVQLRRMIAGAPTSPRPQPAPAPAMIRREKPRALDGATRPRRALTVPRSAVKLP